MSLPNLPHFSEISDPVRSLEALRQIVSGHRDWFICIDGQTPLSVNTADFDFFVAHGRLIFSCWTEMGSTTWKVSRWKRAPDKLVLQATRRMGAEVAIVQMVPHASGKAIVAGISAARRERCERLAQIVTRSLVFESPAENGQTTPAQLPAKIERVTLSPGRRRDQPGRYARIILRLPHERIAFTGTVAHSDARNVDALFSSALLWFARVTESPKRPGVQKLWLVIGSEIVEAARQRHALLRESWRQRIKLVAINDEWTEVTAAAPLGRGHLWRKRLARFPPLKEAAAFSGAQEIVSHAPDAIDVIASRHGQTLRYHGLPFARVRQVMGRERIWFGVEGAPRRLLDEVHLGDWLKLLRDLETYRHHTCRDRRHWLYRASGEAWLESILRRDITRLDPGLIIAPLHAQFRTSHGGPTGARPIDLLALRHDGRLVVIELKVAEDREHVFQGVDYWRRVEAHRRRGHITAAGLFGDRDLADQSPLVYLVAPALRFHPSFQTLARTIAADVEIYRFDINDDWRSGIRVVRRECVNP